jgi:hypothetical protein
LNDKVLIKPILTFIEMPILSLSLNDFLLEAFMKKIKLQLFDVSIKT